MAVFSGFNFFVFAFVLFIGFTFVWDTSCESAVVSNHTEVNRVDLTVSNSEDPAVTRFREYLRINSSHPNPDYVSCITWLSRQATEIGLDFHLKWFEHPNSFVVWLTWNGTDPDLKSILLNSHMDVVAVVPEKWTHPPFEAYKDENGTIFGRGAHDTKSSTAAQLETIRRLKSQGYRPLRSIHLSVLPDEEVDGILGMGRFVNSSEFAALNVGFDLDEATPSPTDMILVEYGQKPIWQFNFTIIGLAAHGSTLPNNTAGEKLQVVIDRVMEFRASQVALLSRPNVTISDVTSVNLVRIGGGIGENIIPPELWVSFDMRLRIKPGWGFTDAEKMLNDIVAEAGSGVSINYIEKSLISAETAIDDTNVWWVQLQKSCQELNMTCVPEFLAGSTDGRFVRNAGIPVFGFSPFIHTEDVAHQDNENINEKEFLAGIDRYATVIKNAASVSALDHP